MSSSGCSLFLGRIYQCWNRIVYNYQRIRRGGVFINLIDILILGLLFFGALQGYRKGLISGLVNLIGNLFGFFIAVKQYLNVLNVLDFYTPLREWIEPLVYRFILPSIKSQVEVNQQETLNRVFSIIPKKLQGLIDLGTATNLQTYKDNVVQTIAQNLSSVLTDNLMRILAFSITYIAVIFIVKILASIILAPFGFLGRSVNLGGGFIFGALSVFVGIAVFVGLISPVLPIFNQGEPLLFLQESWFYPYLVQTFEGLKSIFQLELTQGLVSQISN